MILKSSHSVPLLNPYFDLYTQLQGQDPALLSRLRKKLVWAFSWAIPSQEAVYAICDYSPIVEIGAGTGYWTWLLEQAGARVLAFDQEPRQPPHWRSSEFGNETAVQNCSDHSLFLCWPPWQSGVANNSLQHYLGETVIYVGEWEGRTGDSTFHESLKRDWILVREIEIPCWPGFSDRLYIFRRQ